MGRITLESVRKQFDDTTIIHGADLDIEDGSFVVFVGPSGCGKTTLLRLIAGLEDVTDGRILIDGEDITRLPPSRRGLSMVFQSYALYPHMTVRGNIAFGLKMSRMPKDEIERRVQHAAKILNLTQYLERRPAALSGGQRQRVAIGRAIVREPKGFLFDEPLSNLDAALRVQMRLQITTLQKQLKTTAIYVTHDQVEAMTMADKIVVLQGGRIEQVGSPLDLYERPANLFVAGFIGSPRMNLVEGASARSQGATTIGIRPEHIDVRPGAHETAADTLAWQGRVIQAEHLGSDTFVYVDVPDIGTINARCTGHLRIEVDDTATLIPDPSHLHRFDEQQQAMR
ncbi:ABC transporter ATP-binding protein [Luteimonas abyssi]|uniref:ABC transporter ATP-binding protein n=1 Tax=Luteimonas abyssi TaxID=1247514 RepID=UPI000737D43E|nr:ABC transporter ATP-binding protein [Luteimonas abyssi]